MKKIIIGVLVVVLLVCGYLVVKNMSVVDSLKPAQTTQTKSSDVSVNGWETYTNSKNGLNIIYPTGLSLQSDAVGGYPQRIEFKPANIKLGSSFTLTVYDLATAKSHGAPITDLNSVPKTNYNSNTPTTISNLTVGNLSLQLIKQGDERATIVFIHGPNAYRIDWACWATINQACFNDDILSKLVNGISFTK